MWQRALLRTWLQHFGCLPSKFLSLFLSSACGPSVGDAHLAKKIFFSFCFFLSSKIVFDFICVFSFVFFAFFRSKIGFDFAINFPGAFHFFSSEETNNFRAVLELKKNKQTNDNIESKQKQNTKTPFDFV